MTATVTRPKHYTRKQAQQHLHHLLCDAAEISSYRIGDGVSDDEGDIFGSEIAGSLCRDASDGCTYFTAPDGQEYRVYLEAVRRPKA